MKLKVSDTLKGKLAIPFVYGDFKAGDPVELNNEQVESTEIQSLIGAGLLLMDEKAKKIAEVMVEYKNETKTIIMFSWGLTVRPLQKFFIPKKHITSLEVTQFVKNNKISLSEKIIVKEAKEVTKTVKKSKTIKRINSDSIQDKDEKGVYVVDPNNENLLNKPLPKGVYVHQPGKESKNRGVEAQIQEIDKELSNGVEFVDLKQAKERLIKTQKTIESRKGE